MFQIGDFISRTDDAVEAAWRTRDWGTFVKLWLVTSIGVAVGFLILICVGGALLIEGKRIYGFLRDSGAHTEGTAAAFNAMLMYSGLWNFASAFAAVTAVVGLVSGPFIMLGKSGSSPKTES